MTFYAPFCIPFILGASVMFLTLAWKWGKWLWLLPRDDKKRILFGIPTRRTLAAAWEVVSESLLHRRIFRVNPLLGYMHMSLGLRVVPADRRGVGRDHRLSRIPLRAVAGTRLFQVFRHGAGA